MTKQSVSTKDRDLEDFSDVLNLVGGWGPFQYLLMFAFFPFNIFLGYVSHSPVLTLFTPPHWCKVPALTNLTLEHRSYLSKGILKISSISGSVGSMRLI